MPERVSIFIDGPNLLSGAFENHVWLDYAALLRVLAKDRQLARALWVDGLKPENMESRLKVYEVIRPLGYEVVDYYLAKMVLKQDATGQWHRAYSEKGVDVALATAMLTGAFEGAYEVAVLVSGDSDYCPAVRGVQSYGRRVEAAAFDSAMSQDLTDYADEAIILDDFEEIRLKG